MDIVIDTSSLIAVLVDEPERTKIIALTEGNTLIGPGSIPWEIGNVFSAMFKQNRLTLGEAQKCLSIFKSISLRYLETDFSNVLKLSKTIKMYAYDAYILDCAIRYKSPLLTLDRKLKSAAQDINIMLVVCVPCSSIGYPPYGVDNQSYLHNHNFSRRLAGRTPYFFSKFVALH